MAWATFAAASTPNSGLEATMRPKRARSTAWSSLRTAFTALAFALSASHAFPSSAAAYSAASAPRRSSVFEPIRMRASASSVPSLPSSPALASPSTALASPTSTPPRRATSTETRLVRSPTSGRSMPRMASRMAFFHAWLLTRARSVPLSRMVFGSPASSLLMQFGPSGWMAWISTNSVICSSPFSSAGTPTSGPMPYVRRPGVPGCAIVSGPPRGGRSRTPCRGRP